MSTLFLRTLREDPADAEVPSHRLLVRAGYIRRAAPGIYTWLPLGLRVLRRVEAIIREEMDAIGAQELSFPALLPREPYEATGRWTDYGDGIFRLKDRKGADYLLGPTHEEMFTLVVKDLYSSYKDLPLSIYQIQDKYRDEARPRAGILRGREFRMKDSYSFDVDDAGLEESYQAHRDAYIRDLRPARLRVRHRQGDLGGDGRLALGGVPREGRGRRGHLRALHRAATTPRTSRPSQVRPPAPVPFDDLPAAHVEDTPGTPTIATLVDLLQAEHPRERPPLERRPTPSRTCWSRCATPTAPASRWPSACPATARSTRSGSRASSSRSRSSPSTRSSSPAPGAGQGLHRPRRPRGEAGLGHPLPRRPPRGRAAPRWVTGADAEGRHVLDLVAGRDFTPDGTIEAAEVRDGDPCPTCDDGVLETARGIEMGHIFQLGRKYADALDLRVLDENGKLVTVTMGSYGIGPSRAVAAIAEGTLDGSGLCWPRNVAPADVHLVAAGKDDADLAAADRIAHELAEQGVTVLLDDRTGKVSPGVKFKDAELIGVPTIVVVGRGLADGVVEVKDRRTGDRARMRRRPRRRPRARRWSPPDRRRRDHTDRAVQRGVAALAGGLQQLHQPQAVGDPLGQHGRRAQQGGQLGGGERRRRQRGAEQARTSSGRRSSWRPSTSARCRTPGSRVRRPERLRDRGGGAHVVLAAQQHLDDQVRVARPARGRRPAGRRPRARRPLR